LRKRETTQGEDDHGNADLRQNIEMSKDMVRKSELAQRRKEHMLKMRQSQRKARRYVFFDVETGEIRLNYGGVHEPLKVTNVNNENVEVYELGLRIKEIRENDFESKIFFFMCGNLWEKEVRSQYLLYKWCLMNIEMDLEDLMALGSGESINQYINDQIQKNIPGGEYEERINFFLFDSNWILNDYFNWENNISLSTNRNFS